jgi:putative transport protein
MNWIHQFLTEQPVAGSVLVLFLIAMLGFMVGRVEIKGIGLGVTGVLFAGIIFGHLGIAIEPAILDFVREFGLILFVYTIGMQLGPSFFASLRKEGLQMNAMAAAIVIGGGAITLLIVRLFHIDPFAAPGLFSGATTNTPALGAAQQMLKSLTPGSGNASLVALGYAVSYPVGIAGIIGSLLILKTAFRIDVQQERELFQAEQAHGYEPIERANLRVDNPHLDGVAIANLPGIEQIGARISRIRHAGEDEVATAGEDTVLHLGDIILAVGTGECLSRLRRMIGSDAPTDLLQFRSNIASERVIVTRRDVLGKTLRALCLEKLHNVAVTRIMRGDVEMTAVPGVHLQFGDRLQIVGAHEDIKAAAATVGNSLRELDRTQFIPLFLGIVLGVLLGTIPIHIPGVPIPMRLGIAGGPLIVAIVLSRIGHFGPLLRHMPLTANLTLRELGITLFLACVGLKAGENFFHAAFSATGALWVLAAIAIGIVPLLVVGGIARGIFKLNYLRICGLLSGSMTDPPALAFGNALVGSDAPAVAYATVYPMTMLLRILTAQVLVLIILW